MITELELEEDNEELERKDVTLKNRRGRELATLLALERIAQATEGVYHCLSILLDDYYSESKKKAMRK